MRRKQATVGRISPNKGLRSGVETIQQQRKKARLLLQDGIALRVLSPRREFLRTWAMLSRPTAAHADVPGTVRLPSPLIQ